MGNCISIHRGKPYRRCEEEEDDVPYRRIEEEEEDDEEVIIYEDYSYDENCSTSSDSESDDDYSSAVSQESYLSDWQLMSIIPQQVFLKTTNQPFWRPPLIKKRDNKP